MVSRDSANAPLARVGLETSFKPFDGWGEAELERVCEVMFDQWSALIDVAESTAVLLWIADGSEILEWQGNLDQTVAWASSVGFSNTAADPYGHNVTAAMTAVPYREIVPELTYADIRRVVAALKRVGERMTGKPVTVGATFDAGPEFSHSEFKYFRHPEIVARGEKAGLGKLIHMVRAGSVLSADPTPYASYPEGVSAGTTFGEFLGRQSQSYLQAMEFDYLWLSNGFGFSSFSWTPLGETFDGDAFRPEAAEGASAGTLQFWQDFLSECHYPLEVRGTNFTTGIDIGGDAVPASEIYALGRFRNPPPNSPWGPLNEDFGIELSGYLSRISRLPAEGYLFRFYVNDPWFWQNPWWDFYNREPFDIYLPLSVSRLDSSGSMQTASDVQFLAIDTESGVLDPRAGREVTTHVLRALESRPDQSGPIVWLYPFDEYHDDLRDDPATIANPYFEDWYLTAAINAGLPLNTVVSTADLTAAIDSGALAGRVIVAPTRALTDAAVAALGDVLERGASLVAYGSIERAEGLARRLLGIETDQGIDGDLDLHVGIGDDLVLDGSAQPEVLRHVSWLSGGPITEIAVPGTSVVASVSTEKTTRAYMTSRPVGNGQAVWVRGSSGFESAPIDNHGLRTPKQLDRRHFCETGAMLRRALGLVGYEFSFIRRVQLSQPAVQTIHRHKNAYWFSGYLADTTVQPRFRLPLGAPIMTQTESWVENGLAAYNFGKSFHVEARIFVDQSTPAVISCREVAPFPFGERRSLQVRGLIDARVVALVPADATYHCSIDGGPITPQHVRVGELEFVGISGSLTVTWR